VKNMDYLELNANYSEEEDFDDEDLDPCDDEDDLDDEDLDDFSDFDPYDEDED
jgi:hypothetical protein